MSRHSRSMVLVAGAVLATIATSPAPMAAADPSQRAETLTSLGIVAQTFDIAPDAPLTITLQLPPDLATEAFTPDATLVVTSYGTILDRPTFLQVLDGDLQRSVDTFDLSLDPAVADPNVARPTADTVTITVPTESSQRSSDALQFPQPGVHPVVLDIRSGDRVVAETSTFIHRLRLTDVASQAMPIALVLAQTVEPDVSIDGTVTVSAAATEELEALADSLAAIDAAATTLGLAVAPPRTVQIEPSVLEALSSQNPDLAARLDAGLANSTLVALPRLPIDPSGSVAAGEPERYTQLLRQGEDLLRTSIPQSRVDRSILIADRALTDGAGTLRSFLGTRLLMMPFDRFEETEGNTGLLTDTTQLLTTALADGSTLPTAVIDPYLDDQLDHRGEGGYRVAVEIVAELLVLAQVIEQDGGLVTRHGMVLADTALGVPDAALLGPLTQLLLSTDGLRLVGAADFPSTVDTWLVDGRPIELTLPTSTDLDLTARFTLIDDMAKRIFAHASIVPDSDPRSGEWLTVLEALPSTVVTDPMAAAMVTRLDNEFADIRACVTAPKPFSFTLTGKNNRFQFKMNNRCDTELRVRLRLSSSKLAFPDGDQLVTLLAESDTTVEVRAEALSNGKSSVFLRVYSPATDEIVVVPEVPLTARVNSLAGLSQLLTGAGLLLIASWWAHNWRRSRRQDQAAKNVPRHPSSNGIAGEPPPDAAASSLPPS